MDIRISNITNFQSKAHPVKPFMIRTKNGRLKVCEVTQKDLKRKGFFEKLAKFFCKNFAASTKDPLWRVFKNPKSIDYERVLNDNAKYYEARLRRNDKNMTLLLVKNKRNKIQGACLSYGYDRIQGVEDKVCYIAVTPAYRGSKIGKILVEKTLESAQNKFSDVFITADREACGFYEKLGLTPLKPEDEDRRAIIDFMSKTRVDYPKYTELYTKALQEAKERWYKGIADKIM